MIKQFILKVKPQNPTKSEIIRKLPNGLVECPPEDRTELDHLIHREPGVYKGCINPRFYNKGQLPPREQSDNVHSQSPTSLMPSRKRKQVRFADPTKGVQVVLDMTTPVLEIKLTVSEDARSDEVISVQTLTVSYLIISNYYHLSRSQLNLKSKLKLRLLTPINHRLQVIQRPR